MSKSTKKKGSIFEIIYPFKTTNKEYKIGDSITLYCEKQIAYLKSIKVI